ncbi:MAG: GTP pyrophosphokinase rsh [Alphaproteobacteria bacterium MarineAlpha6_Bin4]|nr:MAG: GTP pyrophosphokinase rsh [Alphaproteobacteria bacterium MarineAlpha6_Bin3]PPR37126.1 MAG: GTP pyrophosphokinase rsh [Alphaproteobacteria bacterium MarineAlpha6_Bin4]|tara:strand:+ start:2321 stop:4444 length:2124 start_codon:yes stop_codon:yes gene_type:complete
MKEHLKLVEKVKNYFPNINAENINKAYNFGKKAHGAQTRASGDPFFSHPFEVANILAQMKLDEKSIITGLLHDVIEDTLATKEEIKKNFGIEVANLVDGVTKLSKITLDKNNKNKQVENLRKFILAISEDIRVLFVKLADRLHNMRTIKFLKDFEKKKKISNETLEIFAPLADRIGVRKIKDELEDLAFEELNSNVKLTIIKRIDFLKSQGKNNIKLIINQLNKILKQNNIKAEIIGREKKPYSIWRKMKRKNISFEQLSDIMAFKIIVEDIDQCYASLKAIHTSYPVVPGRFKDYISLPKQNGYKSIHTSIFGPAKQKIEVQIRTNEMEKIAKFGVAAHWQYKNKINLQEGKKYKWVRELVDIVETSAEPDEFLENTKMDMFKDQVFCFTPKGDLIALPEKSTPIDFAYAVHSNLGDVCAGAKVNGKITPLKNYLKNGDQVEIIKSKLQSPSPNWSEFVKTPKAKSRIKKFIKTKEYNEYSILGLKILKHFFSKNNQIFDESNLKQTLSYFKLQTIDDLYFRIGKGNFDPLKVLHAIYPSLKKIKNIKYEKNLKKEKNPMPLKGLLPGFAINYSKCCCPMPGDKIIGAMVKGKGVAVHTIDCGEIGKYLKKNIISLSWDSKKVTLEDYVGRIMIIVINEPGSLGEIASAIGNNKGNIINLKLTSRKKTFFEMLVDVKVKNLNHFTNIIASIRSLNTVSSVNRIKGK